MRLLLGLEVVEEDAALLGLLTPVLDDDARAVDDLAGVTLTVDLACSGPLAIPMPIFPDVNLSPPEGEDMGVRTETSPLAELLSVGDLDERDLVLAAKSNNELLVGLLLASLVQDAHVGLATVEGLAGLAQTAGESVVDQSDLEDSLEGVQDGHAAGSGTGVGCDFDLIGGRDGGGGLFYIRLEGGVSTGGSIEGGEA